jgi:hypothetical protein
MDPAADSFHSLFTSQSAASAESGLQNIADFRGVSAKQLPESLYSRRSVWDAENARETSLRDSSPSKIPILERTQASRHGREMKTGGVRFVLPVDDTISGDATDPSNSSGIVMSDFLKICVIVIIIAIILQLT